MPTRDTTWPAGTPCWVDLMTTDQPAAHEFYGALLGWEIPPPGPDFGGYSTATLGGKSVAGLSTLQDANHPPVWSTYLASDDLAATTKAIEDASGKIIAPAMQVGDFGSMLIAEAPGGGVFGVWQGASHTGFEIFNETGAVVWNEFMTRDFDAAKDFYATVFGYTYTAMGDDYATVELDGNTVGGIGRLPAEVPSQVPPHWRCYFAVEDADAAAARVEELGGTITRRPMDMPYGRHADVADPQGAMFAIIKPGSPE